MLVNLITPVSAKIVTLKELNTMRKHLSSNSIEVINTSKAMQVVLTGEEQGRPPLQPVVPVIEVGVWQKILSFFRRLLGLPE